MPLSQGMMQRCEGCIIGCLVDISPSIKQHWDHFRTTTFGSCMECGVPVKINLVNCFFGFFLNQLLKLDKLHTVLEDSIVKAGTEASALIEKVKISTLFYEDPGAVKMPLSQGMMQRCEGCIIGCLVDISPSIKQHWDHFRTTTFGSCMECGVPVKINLVNCFFGFFLNHLLKLIKVPSLHRGKQLCLHPEDPRDLRELLVCRKLSICKCKGDSPCT